MVNSPLSLLHFSTYFISENFVLNQDYDFFLISLSILIASLLDIVWIL